MLEIIMVLFTIYTLIKIYISVMQVGYIAKEKSGEPVLMSQEKYQIAGEYAIKKERLGIVSTMVEYGMFVWWVTKGFAWLASILGTTNSTIDAVLFLFGFIAIGFIIGLPFEIYQTFKIDKEYGFTKTTPKLYLLDQVKSISLTALLGGVVIYLLAWIINSFEYWWFWGFVALFIVVLIAQIIAPTIMALFNKFSPLEEGELRTAIEEMMTKVGLKSDGIFVVDASKRDSRLNAYFGGLGKTKRVVLFDTLIEKLTNRELLAVLAHELGHFSHGDIWKNIGMIGILLFFAFALFGNLPVNLFYEMGLEPYAGVKIAMIMLLLALIYFVFIPIMSFVSRHNEYSADKFGGNLGGKRNLATALIKLVDENKSFPKSHPLVLFFYYTHPPVLERLKELGYEDEEAINDLTRPLDKSGIFAGLDES
ncbi:Putative integral membrane zinc-metalloprotease [hydrothermal vent metagenome]|uniref:Putative integral membrane zinc-metalloprotease n=1 Tax=hydrothermal vent metagenome TaxID=652676 RepID=A0A1W1CP98_9ZZZZ